MKPLTKIQREALSLLAQRSRSPWSFGSTTVHVLRKLGYVETIERGDQAGRLAITEAGRAALAGDSVRSSEEDKGAAMQPGVMFYREPGRDM